VSGSAKQSEAASAHREIAVRGRSRADAERVVAEAYAAGAQGCEEREEDGLVTFLLYAPAEVADAVWRAAAAAAGSALEVDAPRALPPVDWSEAWKAELVPIVVSDRLAVRPSFAAFEAAPDQRVLVVDPGQAFGTGAHESTRLALEWVALRAPALPTRARILDVGTGSGVLALAALALAPPDARAFAFDLDPLAAPEARHNAARNALAGRMSLFTGGVTCLAPSARFDCIVANLLRRELEPLLAALAGHLAEGGELALSGLLRDEVARVEAQARAQGLEPAGSLERADASGARWGALLMRRPRAPVTALPRATSSRRAPGPR
jgi:ribosomal protein L11 methyltransferase